MFCKVLFHCCMIASAIAICYSAAHYPKYCAECEEEVWEEVPCDRIPTTAAPPTSTTPTTPTTATPTTAAPPPAYTIPPIYTIAPYPTIPAITTPKPVTSYPVTTAIPLPPTTTTTPGPGGCPNDPHKKCYCDCKVGCKEFCHNVNIDHDPSMQIIQITKTLQNLPDGRRLEVKHEHRYLPRVPYPAAAAYGEASEITAGGDEGYQPGPPPAYENTQAVYDSPKSVAYQSTGGAKVPQEYSHHSGLDEELAHILHSDGQTTGYDTSAPPQKYEPVYSVMDYPGTAKRQTVIEQNDYAVPYSNGNYQGLEPELGNYLKEFIYTDAAPEVIKNSDSYAPIKPKCPSKSYQNTE